EFPRAVRLTLQEVQILAFQGYRCVRSGNGDDRAPGSAPIAHLADLHLFVGMNAQRRRRHYPELLGVEGRDAVGSVYGRAIRRVYRAILSKRLGDAGWIARGVCGDVLFAKFGVEVGCHICSRAIIRRDGFSWMSF